ncbi:cytochrome c oxidase subunit 3 [Sphingomonas quercus]|uniref:Cytochrome c oxidase subunit 3 n=1 Tax=Sphingomonas quercus TaxID=2842451 RepID=A0ABS6BM07_9SPHN|nr:cytochrome c oxidase subunit 3 [Sphingomonas quercus]MBU3079350.1 cytochrome c oxidase subunit 3 [Sphingomonas quercus]
MAEQVISAPRSLPVGPVESHGVGWNGMACLIASEAALFGYLLFSYYYLGASNPRGWLMEPHPDLHLALPNTLLLLASSVAAWWGERGVRQESKGQALAGLALALVMGTVFATVQVYEWHAKTYAPGTSSYASLYFITTGLHMAHVVIGLAVLAMLILWIAFGYFSPLRRLPVSNGVLYWHFVDAVWLFVFTTYYLTPLLGFAR